MQTRLLGYEYADSVKVIERWANSLPGTEAPGSPGTVVVGVLRFQIVLRHDSYYDALVLVEVTDTPMEMQLELKEADIEAIEEITSSIDEPA